MALGIDTNVDLLERGQVTNWMAGFSKQDAYEMVQVSCP